jgi:hypothetical protein
MTRTCSCRDSDSPDRTTLNRRHLLQGSVAAPVVAQALTRHGAAAEVTPAAATPVAGMPLDPPSTAFGTVFVEPSATVRTASDGDLWPSAWADDDNLYILNGDGKGFDLTASLFDVVVNRVTGTPETGITGEVLAAEKDLGPIWGNPADYNRKPTGIVAVDGNGDGKDELYAAIQDLKHGYQAFDDAPAASIAVSRDYGVTWESTAEPMFTDHVFTTIFFLDYGKSNAGAAVLGTEGARYVYAYGIDYNWRDSFTNRVTDPTDLYLARVPIGSIQDRATWEFFSGLEGDQPTWNADIAARQPVLTDTRRVYPSTLRLGLSNMTVIAQGSVTYNAPLERYIYSSWTEYTWEFYEAPQPWGPWTLFLHKDFGVYPWTGTGDDSCPGPKNGGYATVIPSKFISEDGRTMWVQANWWGNNACGETTYVYALRKLEVTPYAPSTPANTADPEANLALEGAVPIEKSTHFGRWRALNDGATDLGEDSYDGEDKTVDFWGYTWPEARSINRVDYTTGIQFPDGGWFEDLRVQVRQAFVWTDVQNLAMSPDYPFSDTVKEAQPYTLTFETIWGDGVRIIGTPGGSARFTSISELGVYLDP